jgi:FeS assembly SUF system protein
METGKIETPGPPASGADALRERVIDAIKTCYDPEIPVNIWELGLIYEVEASAAGAVAIRMTLTSPACPVAGSLPPEVEQKIRGLEGVSEATVDVVWDPPWNPGMMTEAAKLELNMM